MSVFSNRSFEPFAKNSSREIEPSLHHNRQHKADTQLSIATEEGVLNASQRAPPSTQIAAAGWLQRAQKSVFGTESARATN